MASRLSLITIETKNLNDVNAIFESLNAKGKPLGQLDLLRNYTFMMLRERAEEVLADSGRHDLAAPSSRSFDAR